MTRPILILSLLLDMATVAQAGDISPDGTAIEVENYRCTVTSPRTLECQNIGRVCEARRAADKIEHDKMFGCALRSPPDCPQSPDYKSQEQQTKMRLQEICLTTQYGW